VLLGIPKLTFYLWTVALIIVTGITVHDMLNRGTSDLRTAIGLAAVSLVICCLQFLTGRRIGRRYGDPVSSGQGLGQKNTILALWMAQTYLHPLVSIAPATYILWQNMINSYQLWVKNRKNTEKRGTV
jgi:BASS family bile acid:Na+ symporter